MEDLKEEKRHKVFFITGELSGEAHTARVVAELLQIDPSINVRAMGSNILEQFGADIAFDYKNYSFTGLTEVVVNIFKILKLKDKVVGDIIEFEPDVLVLVDYGGFNLEVAKTLNKEYKKRKGTDKEFRKPQIIEYIAPQIWASRPHRIKKIKENVDKVLCTLPFEEEIYRSHHVPVRYVGNPVASSLSPATPKSDFWQDYDKAKERYYQDYPEVLEKKQRSNNGNGTAVEEDELKHEVLVGVFPGSRKSEIKYMLPLMMEAAKCLKARENSSTNKIDYKYKFVLAKAPNLDRKVFEDNGLDESVIELLDPSYIVNANHKLMSASDMLWLCSGTVTLEAALYGVPYFLAYKGNWINYQLYKLFKTIDKAGLANIIADEYIVKEFLQYDATVSNYIKETESWLNPDGSFTSYYQEIKHKLLELQPLMKEFNTQQIVAQELVKAAKAADQSA